MARVEDPGGGFGHDRGGDGSAGGEGLGRLPCDRGRGRLARGAADRERSSATSPRCATGERRRSPSGDAAILGVTAYPAMEERTGVIVEAPSPAPEAEAMVETLVAARPMRTAEAFET